jgi:hypothetical protein
VSRIDCGRCMGLGFLEDAQMTAYQCPDCIELRNAHGKPVYIQLDRKTVTVAEVVDAAEKAGMLTQLRTALADRYVETLKRNPKKEVKP